uniref:hypothetical protein n=1 Tax=uncultured Microbacterium sp. TaxID=191216 RepID=UPI0025F36485
MGLFSRRSKQDDAVTPESAPATAEEAADADRASVSVAEGGAGAADADVPVVNIAVQAFRGLGSPSGPVVDAPTEAPEPGHDLIDPVVDEAPTPSAQPQ